MLFNRYTLYLYIINKNYYESKHNKRAIQKSYNT